MNETKDNLAIYLDFENLAVSAEQFFPSLDQPLMMQPIMDFCVAKGNITVKKAYADWNKGGFRKYQTQLLEQGFELVYLPETSSTGKNGSDVKLAVDAMEDLVIYGGISKVVIGSGDTDFIPLIQKMRARALEVIVLGIEGSVGTLVKKNSSIFVSLEEILGLQDGEDEPEISQDYGRNVLIRLIKNRNSDDPIQLGMLKRELLKIDPSFSERKAGYSSFKKFIEGFENDLVQSISKSGSIYEVSLKDQSGIKSIHEGLDNEMKNYLLNNLRYIRKAEMRASIFTLLYSDLEKTDSRTMSELMDFISKSRKLLKTKEAQKLLTLLFTGKALVQTNRRQQGPLLERAFRMRTSINSGANIEAAYLNEIRSRMRDRYPQ
jgi:uncharacterized protein (TIGR00288 family)